MTTEFLPLLNSYIEKWSRETPQQIALIQAEDGSSVTYRQLQNMADEFAYMLLDMGIRKGDRVATMLLLTIEHVALMFGCFKIGAICATLDVRLKDNEVVRDLNKISPRAFFFLGKTPFRDFREVGRAVQKGCPSVETLVQFTPITLDSELLPGAVPLTRMIDRQKLPSQKIKNWITRRLEAAYARVTPNTPAVIVFTTGTTGAPKPAMINHHNIIVQDEILSRGAGLKQEFRMMVNLPPSHVGCITESLMSGLYVGGTCVIQRIFDARLTLEAVQKYHVNTLGMIPTQYRIIWALPDYDQYDLSSLKSVVYGGASGDSEFLQKLSKMAPLFGTGLGMTESGGFGTYTPPGISVEEMVGQVGTPFEELAKLTVRAPMNADGTAGMELPDGEIGEICYHPPLVFMGYYNQPEATAQVISKEGILYSGDMGYYKDMGSYRALYLSGRRKFIIKQSGFNVFPDEVEAHIAELKGVDSVCVVGVPHKLLGEAIMAFVRLIPGTDLSVEDIHAHCKKIAAYKRPQHIEIWPADRPFPLTRTTKIDKLELGVQALQIADQLRNTGQWDISTHPDSAAGASA